MLIVPLLLVSPLVTAQLENVAKIDGHFTLRCRKNKTSQASPLTWLRPEQSTKAKSDRAHAEGATDRELHVHQQGDDVQLQQLQTLSVHVAVEAP
ncbi:hypothetical protein B0H21DRAFT_766588 [Amylocystis lapponica]|nr:hypothetical protein B0H21DRAFT_766588 [Amylocystis lapponica]